MFSINVMSQTCRRMTRLSSVRFNSGAVTETTAIEKTINQVQLLGRVGADPQKRGSEQHPVVVFSLATHTNYKTDGELTQKTDWHRVCVFKPNLREAIYQHLTKGQRVMVNGRLSYGEIKDDSGMTKPTTAIIADDIVFFQRN